MTNGGFMNKLYIQNLGLIVTERCNLNCKHCLRGKCSNKVMSDDVIEATLSQITAIGVLHLEGGEPTLAIPTIEKILTFIIKNNILVDKVSTVINGTRYESKLIELYDYIQEYINRYNDETSKIVVSFDKYHIEEIKRINLLKDYLDNTSKYAESIYYDGYYEIKNKLFREGNAVNLDKKLTVPLRPMKTFATYIGKNYTFDKLNGLCNIGPIVTINVDGTITESDASYNNQNTIYNYGNVLNASIIECLLKNKMKVVKPNKFENKTNKQIIKYYNYNH